MIKHNKSIRKKLKKTGGYYRPREDPPLVRIGWPFYNQEWSIPAIMLLGMIFWFVLGLIFDSDNNRSDSDGISNYDHQADQAEQVDFGTQTYEKEQTLERSISSPL